MKIITIQKEGNFYIYTYNCRNDSLRHLSRFFDEFRTPDSFTNWLLDPKEDEEETALLLIGKKNGIIYLKLRWEDDQETINYEDSTIYKESAAKLIKLWKDLYEVKLHNYTEIAIMYEEGEYYLKGSSGYMVGFIKQENHIYKKLGYHKTNTLGPFGEFLTSLESSKIILEWLKSDLSDIATSLGKLIKDKDYIIVECTKFQYSEPLLSRLSIPIFLKLMEEYQNIVQQAPEEFLLLEEPTYYSFMTNPFEEIKIYKE